MFSKVFSALFCVSNHDSIVKQTSKHEKKMEGKHWYNNFLKSKVNMLNSLVHKVEYLSSHSIASAKILEMNMKKLVQFFHSQLVLSAARI